MRILLLAAIAGVGCGGSQGVTGPAGPTGAQGPTGQVGATGQAGQTVISARSCNTTITSPTVLLFDYDFVTYSDGGAFVSCGVSGTVTSSAWSQYFKAGANGASSGYCSVTHDIDTPTAGYWTFAFNGATAATVSVTYKDVGSANNQMIVTLTNCN